MVEVVLFAIIVVIAIRSIRRKRESGSISVISLNDHIHEMTDKIASEVMSADEYAAQPEEPDLDGRVYLLRFDGDDEASAVSELRELVTALVGIVRDSDEVVVLLESPGGTVHDYGLAASQLVRVRATGCGLTVCVDKVAASGGYMMACVADQIIAAPWAIIGSVGVALEGPNFSALLKRFGIQWLELTAGEHKRTVGSMGPLTAGGIQKSIEDLNATHDLFKEFIKRHRPQLDVDQIATGEVWYGHDALGLGLIDELKTSDDYLLDLTRTRHVYEIKHKKNERARFAIAIKGAARMALRGFICLR